MAAWNARGPDFEPNGFEYDADDPSTMAGRICVNPISWRADKTHAPAGEHGGAIFFDTEAPALKPRFADGRCSGGSSLITTMGDPERDFASEMLLWMMGPDNYHPIEYQLFYVDLRNDAAARLAAFTSSGGRGAE